ncbi:MAG: hypothetical protein ABSB77_21470 [Xanthobacteraceae bacterium]
MSATPIFKDAMGALAVVITLAAYGIYVWQTLRGEARPHPLSWLIFGILTGTAYLVQRDEAAGPGSWVMGITAIVCLLLCLMSFWRGERTFPWYEWAFLVAAAVIFIFYLWSHEPTISAALAAIVSVLGFGPTVTKAWQRPHSDSITTFAVNSIKFIPAFFAMDNLTLATCVMPAALVVANAAVALIIYARRAHHQVP